MIVVAENDDCRILFQDADSNGCILSFSYMDFHLEVAPFFGYQTFSKLGVAALGITAKSNNWFPSSVRALAELSRRFTDRFPIRMAYGFSMGGYGALKHSRAFGATHVLALSPQYSIDPEDGDGRYANAFKREEGYRSAILREDVSGQITLVVDLNFDPDLDAVRRIVAIAPGTTIWPADMGASHFTISFAKGSLRFAELYRRLTGDRLTGAANETLGFGIS
ncbi:MULTISPECIES: hypothetical protein [unclassified Rhizobium]|uniref:hypothetical protein n=1 Tax=unclassified Rhizobium TaxID=2613769 RepID=UPI00161DB17D|nr:MULTISPECIES: hypothetical protein [unclassified Rhizobium]MBB3385980.1 hypothetical protein [Rhizobium sp. BK098]MBB3617842.1 hypothetical protein [Rhizobium sp. BK609]MBB3683342.1 hypothetical protein [Rhizobium sp. BK612]